MRQRCVRVRLPFTPALRGLILVLLVGVSLTAPAASAQSADDPAALRALAERLLAQPGGLQGNDPMTALIVGQLPPDLPVALPVPPGDTVVGGVTRRSGAMPVNWEVVLDAPGAPDDLLALYRQAFTDLGWTTPLQIGPTGQHGFLTTSIVSTGLTFCQKSTGPYASVSVTPAMPANDVRVRVDTNAGSCGNTGGNDAFIQAQNRLPALAPPTGVMIQGGGSSGNSNGRFQTTATARTTLSAADLEAGYAGQLAAAGWTRVTGATDGPLAWSTWTVPGDGTDTGFLYVLAPPGASTYELSLQVQPTTP